MSETRNKGGGAGRRALGLIAVSSLLLVVAGSALLIQAFRRPFAHPPAQILVAKRIRTLNPEQPLAEAVAVADGKIVGVGSLDALRSHRLTRDFPVNRQFAEKVLLPGFIDPHLHPSLAATILPLEIVSAMEWITPRGRSKALRDRQAFLGRLKELDRNRETPDSWLMAWGYHRPYHGKLSRSDLDRISSVRPIMVWQRSVHEMFFNSAALDALGLTEEDFAAHEQANWKEGHVWEAAVLTLAAPMMRHLAWPPTYRRGLTMMSDVIHRGGLTTVAEQGFPQITDIGELLLLSLEMSKDETPYRFVLVPNAMYLLRKFGNAEAAAAAATSMLKYSTDRIRLIRHIKYYADGAIFSQLMQMSEPYADGHDGEWMMEPEDQAAVLDAFWDKGWGFHIHVNGDAGLDLVLDQIEAKTLGKKPGKTSGKTIGETRPEATAKLAAKKALQNLAKPIVLEHYGYAREDQHERVAALGVAVSNNAYYLHELAPIYARDGLDRERASNISPLGGLAKAGVSTSFHSDFPMAPAEPLRLVWVAVNRRASDGEVWGEQQRLSLDAALRAITIEAARSLGMQEEIGSIEVGKLADFTVLEADPHEVAPQDIKDIGVWGTILEGQVRPIAN